MSARRAAVIFCAVSALISASRFALAEDRLVDLSTAGKGEVIDVGYNAPEKADSHANNGGQNSGSSGYSYDCEPSWHWVMGAEATYMDITLRGVQDIGMDAGPRIWLGLENGNGWGARARYWQITANEFFVNQPLLTSPSPTDVFDQLFYLNLYTIDAEVTKRGEFGDWDWLGFFGGRYAGYQNKVITDITDVGFTNVFVDDIHAQAGGITTGLEASRPIGWGPLSVYGGFRVSALWGDADDLHVARFNSTGSPITQITSSSANVDLTIWEAQVGLQCSKYLKCCQGTVFGRCGFEYQSWSFFYDRTPALPLHDLDLYGVAMSVGITR